MVYAWLILVGHDVYEPKGIIITPSARRIRCGVCRFPELRGKRQRRRR